MSKYTEIKKDFVDRTRKNIEYAVKNDIPYECTNLVNSCFGLIVFPKSFHSNETLRKLFPNDYSSYGLSITDIKKIKNGDKSLASIIIHLRNGLSHGLIEQEVINGDIHGICVCDKDSTHGVHTEIHLSINELHKLALFVSEKVQP